MKGGNPKNTPTDPCALPKSHREDPETRGGVASQEHHPSFGTKLCSGAWCRTPYVHHVSAHDVPPIDGIGLTSTEATSGTPRGSFPPPPSSKRNTLPQVKGVLSLNQNSKTALKGLKVLPRRSHRKRWGKGLTETIDFD